MDNYKPSSKGAKKAAMLLMSLGKEEAAKVMAHLDDKMIEEVIQEMSRIRTVSKFEKENILSEFRETVEEVKNGSKGGVDAAKELLSKSLGTHKAEEFFRKMEKKDVSQEFEFLNEVEPNVIQSLLSSEAPQTIAVTLSYLVPKKAAEVLKLFPQEQQSAIALKLATTSRSFPEAILEIARVLRKKYDARDKSEMTEAGGVQSLANILNHMDKDIEENILKNLNQESPEVAHQVRDKLYAFEDILNLEGKEMRMLLTRLSGNELLTLALRGAGDEMKRHFFNSMSQNRASDILEEMEARGKVTLREINAARSEILKIARKLEEQNQLILKKRKEEFI